MIECFWTQAPDVMSIFCFVGCSDVANPTNPYLMICVWTSIRIRSSCERNLQSLMTCSLCYMFCEIRVPITRLTTIRDFNRIQARGSWKCSQSGARYKKPGCLLLHHSKVSSATWRKAEGARTKAYVRTNKFPYLGVMGTIFQRSRA